MNSLKSLQFHISILEKVESFERKSEFNRFLLILNVTGFIAIIGGWISYVFNRFIGVDTTFFIFGMTGNPSLAPSKEPILFFSVWLLYLIPIFSMLILTTGSTGIVSWNKAYRKIGILAIVLFFMAQGIILILGISNSRFIPFVWSLMISCGSMIAGRILLRETQSRKIQIGLFAIGLCSLFTGLIVSIFLSSEISLLTFCIILGLVLSVSGLIGYYTKGRLI